MNQPEIYQQAISPQKETPASSSDEESKEIKEEKELRYLNYNLQQTTMEIKLVLINRKQELADLTSNLSQTEGYSYVINRNLSEYHIINKILNLIKTGVYNA
jgi:hypothetical protein